METNKSESKTLKMMRKRRLEKVLLVLLPICLMVFTVSCGYMTNFMDSKPMQKTESDLGEYEDIKTTDRDIDTLIPAEGIFLTDPILKDQNRVNILMLGTTDNGLSDTIMLLSADMDTETVDIISVPRDTYYERPGHSGASLKLNAVNHDGPLAVAKAVHEILLGIPIDYYAEIDYEGVEKIVDSVGGVTIDVPQNMDYDSDWQNLHIHIKKGKQTLSGEKAVQFLRFRSGYRDGDIGRVRAQQQFVKALIKEASGLNLAKLAMSAIENVDSDISVRAVLHMADALKDLGADSDQTASYTLPGKYVRLYGLSFMRPAEDPEIEAMLKTMYSNKEYIVTTSGAITISGSAMIAE
jgi:LCP family protein required for cell wall assembly